MDEWSKDASTQTDLSDQAVSPDSSTSSSCNHSFTEAIDCIIQATSEPQDEVLGQAEVEFLQLPQVEFLEEAQVEVLEEAQVEVVEQV